MSIFQKTEVQTVKMRCLTGLNLDWFKSYGLRCSLRPCACSANSQKRHLINSHFTTISGQFFANYMIIFHKTEVQTVILRCLTSLNLNWYKSYDTKRKNAKNANECFCTKLQKTENGNMCILCHNFWTNWDLEPWSTSKWPSEPQFCERWTYKWRKNGQK